MRINHGGIDVTVPHQLLDASKTASAWQARKLGLHISMLTILTCQLFARFSDGASLHEWNKFG
jgi:hypothetical protein